MAAPADAGPTLIDGVRASCAVPTSNLRPDARAVVRCPPRALNLVVDVVNACPRHHTMQPHACLAEKNPLTNRIRRHFARIKAIRPDRGQSWLLREIEDGQDISEAKVRRRPSGRSGYV